MSKVDDHNANSLIDHTEYSTESSTEDSADSIDHTKINSSHIHQKHKLTKLKYPNGYLKIVYGPMYSGKSTDLKTDKNDWSSIKNIRILVINYAGDRRYTDKSMVMTHNKEGVECISVTKLSEITNGECKDEYGEIVLPQNYHVILVDEGQFYSDLVENIIYWTDILEKTVHVYGLVCNFKREKFGNILDLIPLADKAIQKTANCELCNNGSKGLFSWKLKDTDVDASIQDIASTDKYITLCRKHYNRLNKPKSEY